MFYKPLQPDLAVLASPEITVQWTAHGSGVALEVDSWAVWRPSRTVATPRIPASVTGVEVTMNLGGKRIARRRLPAGAARIVAARINSLPIDADQVHTCGQSVSGFDALVFVDGSRRYPVSIHGTADAPECDPVELVFGAQPHAYFEGGYRIDQTLRALLKLPR